MTKDLWTADSFEGRALRAAQKRQAEQQGAEREARANAFARLAQPILGEDWPAALTGVGASPTEVTHGPLRFHLFSLHDEQDLDAATLAVTAECPRCRRPFSRSPVTSIADVGEVLMELHNHPDCVAPTVVSPRRYGKK